MLVRRSGSVVVLRGDIILQAFMMKRSRMIRLQQKFGRQLAGYFCTPNFQSRWFILTDHLLTYHEGALEGAPLKEKGRVILQNVTGIEKVDAEALPNRPLAFQIVYNDKERRSCFTLIVVTVNEHQRTEWVDKLRTVCKQQGAKFRDKYHPGVFNTKHGFSCCNNINRDNVGCILSQYVLSDSGVKPTSPLTSSTTTTTSTVVTEEMDTNNHVNSTHVKMNLLRKISKCNKILVAQYSFDTNESNHIQLVKGDSYELLDNTNHDWWFVKNSIQEDGYAPANFFICGTNALESYDWYFSDKTRIPCEVVLLKDGTIGCFMIRMSSRSGYSISILYHDQAGKPLVKHYQINTIADPLSYYISNSHKHDSIQQLVAYHKLNRGRICTRLTHPPARSRRPETVGFGLGIDEICRNDLQILNILGQGNFGLVKKAIYIPQHKEVAVKMMNEETMLENDFILEAKNMKHFSHSSLVQLYGICSIERPIYIISEFMCNGSLEKYLRLNRDTMYNSPSTMLDFSVQIASAMTYLESEKYIHRDLAARNCLVGEDNIVKVADFGLTRYVLDDIYTSRLGAKFPIKWSAPEVLEYSLFSSKSDVWAFGIVMWEIWTCGEVPFSGISNDETTRMVCYQNATPGQPANCSDEVYGVIASCWNRESESRPPFHQLINSLTALLDTD